jgi:hypothetical protein
MNEEERRQYEKARYSELKNKKGGTNVGDGTVIFYVICAEWIERWKGFIQ